MGKHRRLFMPSLLVGFSSLLYIDFFVNNFKFSFAGVVFPLVLYIYDESNPISLGFTSGLTILLFRGFFYGLTKNVWGPQYYYLMPEVMFYIAYGFIFYLVRKTINFISHRNIFIIALLSDIISNLLETYLRFGQNLFNLDYNILRSLLIVGLIRAALLWLIVIGYENYKRFLVREEHEERYRNLLRLTSQLKTETYWMEKNMDYIEKVMSKAYNLFTNISEGENKENWAKDALEIATDTHEIKKEYNLIIVGIEDIMSDRLDEKGMYFYELISILKESFEREIRSRDKDIRISYDLGEDFYTNNHYYLMSVLRNLIMNAIDSIGDKGKISVSHEIFQGQHKILVKDNGRGIKKEDLASVFSPGYSTKIDYSTGEINRGLGLALVKSIVEVQLKGKIEVESDYGQGCSFLIAIAVEEMESEKK